ncbi:LPS export ABC transporter periplasmic protein LptC [Marivirga sp. S37H4]|uniref:LPS export ABC transporter periplasmic protein LptC n=1 Tax=Marivirga aurantiaca TaxID=2802615 RepID=A0A934WVQ0_9BACT|nr:OstA-like protein [Marivirga aurantiaca]MBK6263928.1 LPS export ABC transporter periplasmic protein LptC [Marivirga aurantiaca]
MKFQRILFLSLLLISTFSLHAQRGGVKYGSSGYSESVNKGSDRFTRLVKDVWFDIKDKDTRITGDSALYYDKQGIMIVFGDVRIKKGDSVTITARRLNYYMNDNKAELRNNVVYEDKRIRLTTNYLDYYTNTEDARFYNGGKIVDGETTLEAEDAYVINAENLIKFYEDVKLKSPDYDLKTDTLFYHQITKIATTYGPTQTIMKDGEIIDAKEGGRFQTDSKQVTYLEGKITTESYEIFGDDLFFDDIRQESRAKGNVRVISEEDNIIILGDEATTQKDSGITKIWGNPVMKQLVDNDTLYMSADTLISIDSKVDSLSRLLAYKNVKIFKSDMQGVADSMAYMMLDSMIFLYEDPILWSDGNQITADTIALEMVNGKLDKMKMKNRAFTINKDTVANFNQIKGRNMTAYFKNDKMDKILVNGNGESIYFAIDDKDNSLIGMNKILCSNMKIQFLNGQMNDITFYKDPEGRFIPPHEINEPETRLKDFNWQIDKKPELKEVLGKHAPLALPSLENQPEIIKPDPSRLKGELKKIDSNEK